MVKYLISICTLFLSVSLLAQTTQNVVYLKNGSQIRGDVKEFVPGSHIKVVTSDQSIWVFQMANVDSVVEDTQFVAQTPVVGYEPLPAYASSTRGYYCDYRIGALVGRSDFGNMLSFSTTLVNGYKINDRFGAGMGLAFETVNGAVYLPVYGEGRFEFLNGQTRPFVLGYSGWSFATGNNNSQWSPKYRGGFMGGVEIGVRNQISSNAAFLFGFGYRYMNYKIERNDWWWGTPEPNSVTWVDIYNLHRLSVKFGFLFN